MPTVRVQIGEQEVEGPSEKMPELLQMYPDAKVLGLAPSPIEQMASEVGQTALERFNQFHDIPTTAMFTGLQAIGSAGKQLKKILPQASEVEGSAIQHGIPPKIAAAAGNLAEMGKAFVPENDIETGLMLAGEPLGDLTTSYLKRVAPSLIETFFPGVGKLGADMLASQPQKIAQLASGGPEAAGRAEVAAVNKIRAGVGQVLKNARSKFGEVKNTILAETQNPSIDAAGIQQAADQSLADYNFLPELKTTQVMNPKAASAMRAVAFDVEDFATRPGNVNLNELMNLRQSINGVLRSPISDRAKGGLGVIKEAVDNHISSLMDDSQKARWAQANASFRAVAEKYPAINQFVQKAGAAKRITTALENNDENGLMLKDFVNNAALLDDLSAASASRRFAGNVYRNIRASGSPSLITSIPAGIASLVPGAGLAGQMGVPVTPQGLANFAAFTSRIVRPAATGAAIFGAAPAGRYVRSRLFSQ